MFINRVSFFQLFIPTWWRTDPFTEMRTDARKTPRQYNKTVRFLLYLASLDKHLISYLFTSLVNEAPVYIIFKTRAAAYKGLTSERVSGLLSNDLRSLPRQTD